MIPQKIHYFWFSNDPLPKKLQDCLKSWEKFLPEYEIIKWDLTNCKIGIPFTKKALKDKKWAFLTDYFRLKVLFEQGGVFMDTDMMVVKSFNDLLDQKSFWGFSLDGVVEPTIIGSVKYNPLLKHCFEYYENIIASQNLEYIEIPKIITPILQTKGLVEFNNKIQRIDLGIFYTPDYFHALPFQKADDNDYKKYIKPNTYALHLWNANWFDPFRFFWNGRYKTGFKRVFKEILKNPFQSINFYRNLFFHVKRYLKIKSIN